jgi:signal transduction histidine kinase
MICYLYPETTYFFFSSDAPLLLYYAHIPTIIISLFVGFFVFWNARNSLLNRLLLAITTLFSFWTIINLITWTNIHSSLILFVWSFFSLILSLLAILCIYFIYVFLEKKDVSDKIKVIFLTLLTPSFILASTNFNLSGFDITNCDAFKFEWLPFKIYYTSLGVLAMIWIFVLLVRKYRVATTNFKKQIVLIGMGIELFLFSFFVMVFLASYLTQIGVLQNSELEMYGLFGMLIFITYLGILIIEFKAFNVKLIATQALVWVLIALIGAEFFFISGLINYILVGITFIGIIIFGDLLFRSVKKEIQQKEEIEKMAEDIKRAYIVEKKAKELEIKANEELKNLDITKNQFLLQTQHDLRTPLTVIRGYCDLLIGGNVGKQNKKTVEILKRIQSVTDNKIRDVNNFLDIAQFQLGKSPVSLKPNIELSSIIDEIFSGLETIAIEKGIYLRIEKPKESIVLEADREKIKAAIFNIIDNSIKYTPKGGVDVKVETNGSIKITISDTGIGIPQDKIKTLFDTAFQRGEEAKKTFAKGRGVGLYLSSQIIKAHKGKIWVESKGEGNGSTFYIELPKN